MRGCTVLQAGCSIGKSRLHKRSPPFPWWMLLSVASGCESVLPLPCWSPLVCVLLLCYTEEEMRIVSGLRNTDVFAGESATFTCELSCAGVQNAQWWLDGSPLQSSSVNEISVQDGRIHTLNLKDLGPNDSGIVTFRAGPLISSGKLLIKGILALEWNDGSPPQTM